MNDCARCLELAPLVRKLRVGESMECDACGCELVRSHRVRVRHVPRDDGGARALDDLLRDAATIACWWARMGPKAINLDPEMRLAGGGDDSIEHTVRVEQRARRGHALERVMQRLVPDVRGIVRWVVERGGEGRLYVVKAGAQVITFSLADAFAADNATPAQRVLWKTAGQAKALARTWGEAELARAALAWREAKLADGAQEAVFHKVS